MGKRKKDISAVDQILVWSQALKFPVTNLKDIAALAYVSRSQNYEIVSENLLKWQTRMMAHIEAEHDLDAKVGKI